MVISIQRRSNGVYRRDGDRFFAGFRVAYDFADLVTFLFEPIAGLVVGLQIAIF